MSKHTPGPWIVSDKIVGYALYEIHFNTDGECVAEVVHKEADALLIAAAPELLEALQNLLKANPNSVTWDYPAACDAARRIILKATTPC